MGNDAAIAFGGAAGNLELNVMLPVLARNILESIRLLSSASRLLADRCIDGMTADVARTRAMAESSPAIVTPLNHYVGYDEAAAIAKQALKEGKTIKDVVIERGHVASGKISA
ncbi:MAG: fumarate hydratase, class, partial [Frankiaceae bacterium]|nr:fumarate hydratase, class [Frankiaceae bacterium]